MSNAALLIHSTESMRGFFLTCFSHWFTVGVFRYFDGVRYHGGGCGRLLVQDLFQQIIEFKVDSVGPRWATDSKGSRVNTHTHTCPANSEVNKMSIHVQHLPHGFLTLTIVGFQPFDPGVALPCAAGEAVDAESLWYLGENVAVMWVAFHAPLDLNVGDILSKGGNIQKE